MQTFRSTLQFTVRREATVLLEEFDELTKEDLAGIRDPVTRETSPGLQWLIGFNATPTLNEPKYPTIPPVICQGGSGDLNDIFQNAAIRKLITLVLFGPSQMTTIPPNRSETCQASLWKVTEVTPGMIALAGTLVSTVHFDRRMLTSTSASLSRLTRHLLCANRSQIWHQLLRPLLRVQKSHLR
jgi:hypothetical protein